MSESMWSEGARTFVRPPKEIDIYSVARLRADLAAAATDGGDLVIVMDEVIFCDSTGLGAMIGAYKRVRERGGRFVLVGVCPNLRKILERTSLSTLFELLDDVDDLEGAPRCREPA